MNVTDVTILPPVNGPTGGGRFINPDQGLSLSTKTLIWSWNASTWRAGDDDKSSWKFVLSITSLFFWRFNCHCFALLRKRVYSLCFLMLIMSARDRSTEQRCIFWATMKMHSWQVFFFFVSWNTAWYKTDKCEMLPSQGTTPAARAMNMGTEHCRNLATQVFVLGHHGAQNRTDSQNYNPQKRWIKCKMPDEIMYSPQSRDWSLDNRCGAVHSTSRKLLTPTVNLVSALPFTSLQPRSCGTKH